MTPAEVRAIVERVVAEHGPLWSVSGEGSITVRRRAQPGLFIRIEHALSDVRPVLCEHRGDAECARAVSLWPEMQRLCAMLREALAGPKAAP